MDDLKTLVEHPECCWGYIDELRMALAAACKERDKLKKELHEAKSELNAAVRVQETLQKELAKCKVDRDAAVNDLNGECFACEHVDTDCPAMNCRNGEKFKWRGTKKENHHEKTDD